MPRAGAGTRDQWSQAAGINGAGPEVQWCHGLSPQFTRSLSRAAFDTVSSRPNQPCPRTNTIAALGSLGHKAERHLSKLRLDNVSRVLEQLCPQPRKQSDGDFLFVSSNDFLFVSSITGPADIDIDTAIVSTSVIGVDETATLPTTD
ncbi:hypothetical protein V6N13_040724 [Hibiscus sabdariffa]